MNKKSIILNLAFMILLVINVAAVNITNMTEDEFKTEVQKYIEQGIKTINNTNELNDFVEYINKSWPEFSKDPAILSTISTRRQELARVKPSEGPSRTGLIIAVIAIVIAIFGGGGYGIHRFRKSGKRAKRLEERAEKKANDLLKEWDEKIIKKKNALITRNEKIIGSLMREESVTVVDEEVKDFLMTIYRALGKKYHFTDVSEFKAWLIERIKEDSDIIKREGLTKIAGIDNLLILKQIEKLREKKTEIEKRKSLEEVVKEILGEDITCILRVILNNSKKIVKIQEKLRSDSSKIVHIRKKERDALRKKYKKDVEKIEKLIEQYHKEETGDKEKKQLDIKIREERTRFIEKLSKESEKLQKNIRIIIERIIYLQQNLYIPLKERIEMFEEILGELRKSIGDFLREKIGNKKAILNKVNTAVGKMRTQFANEKIIIEEIKIAEIKTAKVFMPHLRYIFEQFEQELEKEKAGKKGKGHPGPAGAK